MGCGTFFILTIPIFYFALRATTDFSPDPPRCWQRPRSYGLAFCQAAVFWSLAWFGPTLWHHRSAFDGPDFSDVGNLGIDLVPLLPAGLGAVMLGEGVYLLTSAYTRVGRTRHCRRCGYEYSRHLSAKCPECGNRWNLFGGTAIGEPRFLADRAALGTALAVFGIAGLIAQAVF